MVQGAEMVLSIWFQLNITLFVFNLVPLPPLDGSYILRGLLPRKHEGIADTLEQHRMMVMIVFLLVGASVLHTYVTSPIANFLANLVL